MARAPRLDIEHRTLELDPEAHERITVVADTHSRPHANWRSLLAEEAPRYILHAGDIGKYEVIEALNEVADTHAVRGNIDPHRRETPDALVLDVRRGEQTRLRILLLHIAVHGPRLRRDARAMARAHDAHMVICGHSHVPLMAKDDDLIVFNPGSIGPRRFHLPITFGRLEITEAGMTLAHLDCETGTRWTPPGRPRSAG